jgi:hypothetical protein
MPIDAEVEAAVAAMRLVRMSLDGRARPRIVNR